MSVGCVLGGQGEGPEAGGARGWRHGAAGGGGDRVRVRCGQAAQAHEAGSHPARHRHHAARRRQEQEI